MELPGRFCLHFLNGWSEADGTCFRRIACSCRYCAWVKCCGLNSWRWVALFFIAWIIAPLPYRTISQKVWFPWSTAFFLWSTLKETVEEQTSHHSSLERLHLNGYRQQWERCSAVNGRDLVTSCSDLSSGGRWPFSTLMLSHPLHNQSQCMSV